MEAVDVDEDVHDQPEEGKRVHLEIGEESESKHIQKVFVFRSCVFVEEAARKGRFVLILFGLILFHNNNNQISLYYSNIATTIEPSSYVRYSRYFVTV